MNARQKGLSSVREVKKILEGMGSLVEGPGYKSAFFNERATPVHTDYFGVFDLISYSPKSDKFQGHQVTDIGHKAEKIKNLQEAKIPGSVWCRCVGPKIFYRFFVVYANGTVEEGEIRWKFKIKKPETEIRIEEV